LSEDNGSGELETMHFLLFYDYVADILERREPYRAEHLSLALQACARGELVLAGALADPVDGGVLLFESESEDVPRRFVEADPYVKHGLVVRWRIRKWTTVVGESAASPVRVPGPVSAPS
jgi:uncharacterized protein YciI